MKTWYEKHKAKEKKRFDKMEAKRVTLKNPVYVITPWEHGNGGWCGATIHGVYELEWILRRNPVKMFHNNHYDPSWGSQIVLNNIQDANYPMYKFDHEDTHTWVKPK